MSFTRRSTPVRQAKEVTTPSPEKPKAEEKRIAMAIPVCGLAKIPLAPAETTPDLELKNRNRFMRLNEIKTLNSPNKSPSEPTSAFALVCEQFILNSQYLG